MLKVFVGRVLDEIVHTAICHVVDATSPIQIRALIVYKALVTMLYWVIPDCTVMYSIAMDGCAVVLTPSHVKALRFHVR